MFLKAYCKINTSVQRFWKSLFKYWQLFYIISYIYKKRSNHLCNMYANIKSPWTSTAYGGLWRTLWFQHYKNDKYKLVFSAATRITEEQRHQRQWPHQTAHGRELPSWLLDTVCCTLQMFICVEMCLDAWIFVFLLLFWQLYFI